jgi:hypothetical protein
MRVGEIHGRVMLRRYTPFLPLPGLKFGLLNV